MFGVGPLISAAILAELGDARRFSSSRHAVRFAGLDSTVYSPDARSPGGSPGRARACCAGRSTKQPDRRLTRLARPRLLPHLAARLGKSRAKVALARKLLRRAIQ